MIAAARAAQQRSSLVTRCASCDRSTCRSTYQKHAPVTATLSARRAMLRILLARFGVLVSAWTTIEFLTVVVKMPVKSGCLASCATRLTDYFALCTEA